MPRRLFVAAVVALLGAAWNAMGNQMAGPSHPAAQAALRYFESVQYGDFEMLLRTLRRPAPSSGFRALILQNLPREGALSPTDSEKAKLAATRPLLLLHEREDSLAVHLFTFRGVAFIGLHARSVLLISREALGLLSTDELVALVAHELGHDYFWQEYVEAREQGATVRLQELDLRCDGIALIAMARLGVRSDHLIAALRKLVNYNERLNVSYRSDDSTHAPVEQRAQFVRSMAVLAAGSAQARRDE